MRIATRQIDRADQSIAIRKIARIALENKNMTDLRPDEREQQAREFVANYSLGDNVNRLVVLLKATEAAVLEEAANEVVFHAYAKDFAIWARNQAKERRS